MGYEPQVGVITEEDKMRLVLADTGHNVELPENLKNSFDASPQSPESDEEGVGVAEATPSTEEPSEADKEAEEARKSTMEHMDANPETSGEESPKAEGEEKPESEEEPEHEEKPEDGDKDLLGSVEAKEEPKEEFPSDATGSVL